MKKIAASALVLSILISTLTFSRPVHAATHNVTAKSNGTQCSDGGSFDPAAITIASGDTITFSVPNSDPYKPGLEIHNFPGGSFTLVPGGPPHTTPALVISVPNYYATWPSSGCQKGTGSVTVQQQTTPPPTPPPPPTATPPAAATPAPSGAPPSSPTNTNKPPDALKLDTAAINGDKVDISKPIKVSQSQPLTISGNTIPNGTVNLTIHSIARNELARANEDGFWTFTIMDLEPGDHTIDASVTDLSTHLTSANATLLKFAVSRETAVSNKTASTLNTKPAPKTSSLSKIITIIVAVIFLAGIDGFVFWSLEIRKKPKKLEVTKAPSPTEIAPTI
jgi:hypothetical protein